MTSVNKTNQLTSRTPASQTVTQEDAPIVMTAIAWEQVRKTLSDALSGRLHLLGDAPCSDDTLCGIPVKIQD